MFFNEIFAIIVNNFNSLAYYNMSARWIGVKFLQDFHPLSVGFNDIHAIFLIG